MIESLPNLKRLTALKGIILLLAALYLIAMSNTFYARILGLTKLNSTTFLISRLLFWVCIGLLWLYVKKVEKQPLLPWKEKNYTFLFYMLSAVAILFILIAGLYCINKLIFLLGLSKKSKAFALMITFLQKNMPLLIFSCLTAGICEEIIFRGYILSRFEIIFKSHWPAIIASSLLFGLLHIGYGTVANVAGPVFIGIVFAYYYWKYRNIKLIIAFHFLWDFVLLLIAISYKQ